MNLPCRTRIVDEHIKSVSLLLHLRNKTVTALLVLQVGDNVVALTRTELVEAVGGFLELRFFARSDDYVGTVLDECLCCHLAYEESVIIPPLS